MFTYRFCGDTPKVLADRLREPGETVESAEPLHNGQLEPISDEAKQYAEDNGLVLTHYAPWQRPSDPTAPAKPSKSKKTGQEG
jgi:hypothetical protein